MQSGALGPLATPTVIPQRKGLGRDFSPNINVRTLGQGANGKWKLQFTTESLNEAAAQFADLEQKGRMTALYEFGLLLHEGKQTTGQVGFWWSVNFNEYIERGPEGRGVGWLDGFDTWVEYSYPEEPTIIVDEPALPGVVDTPAERYVEGSCDHCGKILPMNQLKRLEHEVRVGLSSGTSRTSRSTSSRFSCRSFSNSSTFGPSSSSGRNYYKTEIFTLCSECFDKQVKADRGILGLLWDAFIHP